jgi:hypothetical protein
MHEKEFFEDVYINGEQTNYAVSNHGNVINKVTGRKLSPAEDQYGYLKVSICGVNGKKYTRTVHQLVARAHIPIKYVYRDTVNHMDTNKHNNHVTNLKWATNQEQIDHATMMGLRHPSKGESHWNTTLKESDVRRICELLEQGYIQKDITAMTGIKRHIIYAIKEGQDWKDISREYNLNSGIKYTTEFKNEIKDLLREGLKPSAIMQRLQLDRTKAHLSLIEKLQREIRLSGI